MAQLVSLLIFIFSTFAYAENIPFSGLISEGLQNERKIASNVQEVSGVNSEQQNKSKKNLTVEMPDNHKKDFKIKLKKAKKTKKKKKSLNTSSLEKINNQL